MVLVDCTLDCRGRLEGILAWEWNDPDLQALHLLTGAAYNLQHPSAFLPEALEELWQSLVDYLDGRATVDEIRRRTGAAFDGPRRVLLPEEARVPVVRSWVEYGHQRLSRRRSHAPADRVRPWAEGVGRERPHPPA